MSEYQYYLATDNDVIDVDRSDIMDIKAGLCNHVHNQGNLDPDQDYKAGGSLHREVVQASA